MKTQYKFTITNGCTCTYFDEETGETSDSSECWGYCFDDQLEGFANITQHLFDANETGIWRVSNIKLWDREVGGFSQACDAHELLQAMTVRGEWIIRGTIYDDKIEYSLSHHDAPTGSSSLVEIVTEEQREEWGLY